jgi:TatA/E family protein of Tat protein translocase
LPAVEKRSAFHCREEAAMLGPQDLWIALALGVFLFGAKKLPELSRSLGQAMAEFKKGVSGAHDEPPAAPLAPGTPEAAPEAGKPQSAREGGQPDHPREGSAG